MSNNYTPENIWRSSQPARELVRIRHEAIRRMHRMAAFKDGDTSEHIERIGAYAARIGKELGQDTTFCRHIERAAPLHDIGKLAIPDSVLKKPGSLDDDEWTIMKMHPHFGADLLGGMDIPVFDMATEIALYHHERFGGGGYPFGLIGKAIPLSARIVTVVDFFDALTMDRCYRPAKSFDETFRMMDECQGRLFDPAIVETFFSISGEMTRIRENHCKPKYLDSNWSMATIKKGAKGRAA